MLARETRVRICGDVSFERIRGWRSKSVGTARLALGRRRDGSRSPFGSGLPPGARNAYHPGHSRVHS
jgi:hypothetical protein